MAADNVILSEDFFEGAVNYGGVRESASVSSVALPLGAFKHQHRAESASYGFEEIVGSSAAIRKVLQLVRSFAPTDSTGLILGETGTGKEVIARAIHMRSERARRPFIRVNCAAIPQSLIANASSPRSGRKSILTYATPPQIICSAWCYGDVLGSGGATEESGCVLTQTL